MSTNNKTRLESLLKLVNLATQEAIAEYDKAGGDVPAIDSTEPHPLDDAIDYIALKSAIRTLEGACAQLCATLSPPAQTVINLVQVYDSVCFHVAVQENITDVLVNYPKGIHVGELSKIVNVDAEKLARLMRLLATRGYYNEVETDTFTNNRLSLILHSENPVRHMVTQHVQSVTKGIDDPKRGCSEDPEHAPVMYANNKEGITGTFFDWMRQDDARREYFHKAMKGVNSIMSSLAVLTQFPFEKYSTIVDVGGGIGAFSIPLAKTHQHITITIQDLPEVLAEAQAVWERDCPEAVQESRIEFVELNFFTQIPVKGKDIYYLRNIIHNWPDQHAALIFHTLRQALGSHSRVLVHDYVLPELNRKQAEADAVSLGTIVAPEPLLPNFGVGNVRLYQQDMTMLALVNARERMLRDILELTIAASLKLEKVWDLVETCILEFSAA